MTHGSITSRSLTRRTMLQTAAGTGAALALQTVLPAMPALASQTVQEALVDAVSLRENIGRDGLVTVGFMPADEFAVAHVPGSAQIDWPDLEVTDTSDESIAAWEVSVGGLLGEMGIEPASVVVAYDNGTLFAARLWWILRYLGHERVHVLDGGLPAWEAAGGDIAEGGAEVVAGDSYGGNPNPDALAQIDEVVASLGSDDVAIVDARTGEEYADGHIPGAVNVNYPQNALSELPKFWRPAQELLAIYEDRGVTPDKLVIPYCSSGVRSAVTAFTLHLIGFEQVALYTGS